MAIGTKDLTTQEFGVELGKGVWAKCQPIYGYDIQENEEVFGAKCEYGFTVGFDTGITKSDGSTFIRKKTWAGDWKKDKDGVVEGWGKLYGLGLFFKTLGISVDVTDNGRINPKQLLPLKGMKVWRVEYASNTYEKDGETKVGYNVFNTFFPEDTPTEKIKEVWEKSLAKGYPNNYDPSLLDSTAPTKASKKANKDWGW